MIYLVEDDNSIRELVIYTLQTTGMKAKGFACAREFWEAMKEELPGWCFSISGCPTRTGCRS